MSLLTGTNIVGRVSPAASLGGTVSSGAMILNDWEITIEPIAGVTTLQGDMTDPEIQSAIVEAAGGRADVVLSDAAPSTTGIKLRDHVLSIELARAAFGVARRLLVPRGNMVLKVFEGEDLPPLIRDVKMAFHPVKVHTPAATRNESWESFIVARGYKGTPSGHDS